MDIEALKNYFKNRDDVAFAFLYGSQVKGKATQLSDVDKDFSKRAGNYLQEHTEEK